MSIKQIKTRREMILDLENKVSGLISSNTMIQGAMVKTHQLIESRISEMARDIREMVYINRAMMAMNLFDSDAIDAKVDEYKLADFEKYLESENKANGFIATLDEIKLDSAVVLNTSCPSKKDVELLRARLIVEKIEDETLKASLVGKKAGDSFDHVIRGEMQKVSVISVFQKDSDESAV